MKSPGEAAKELPWLPSCARSLVALARSPLASSWSQLKCDPGIALLVARAWGVAPVSFQPRACDAKVLRTALNHLRRHGGSGFVDWARPDCAVVYRTALRQAHLAEAIAHRVPACDPHRAWVGGLLASLGWMAALAAKCSCDEFDSPAVARRLCRRWHLPSWLTTIAGHLGLTAELASRLGADPLLFRVVQVAVLLRGRETVEPHLPVGADWGELLAYLRLSSEQVEHIARTAASAPLAESTWESPASQPLLADMLELALRERRRDDTGLVGRLHDDIDRLHEALAATHADENRRLQALKLSALAEFAAGAGHEINNPLAVISGQAQFLLRRLELVDGPAEEIDNPAEYLANLRQQLAPSLQKIVGQTQRIHSILTDLMQFARPASPRTQAVDVAALIHEAAAEVDALAQERGIRLVCAGPELPLTVQGDPGQLRTSLAALLRNAVEAAPTGGWAGVRVEQADHHRLVFAVEDSGPGPGPLAYEHLFDPFFSGRTAGRGRGMGLPTAWRLARQQDGDVRFDGTHDGITRFSLVIPILADTPKCAYANGQSGGAQNGSSTAHEPAGE